MFCSKCGSRTSDGAVFCPNCGAALADPGQRPLDGSVPTRAVTSQRLADPPQVSLDYASAKAQYKQARKAAGIGKRARVIASGAAIALVAVGAVGSFAWAHFGGQPASNEPSNVVIPESSSGDSSSVPGNTKAEAAEPVGTWRGACEKTTSINTGANYEITCFGGELSDMVLAVKRVTEAGRVEADITVVYHGHKVTYKSPNTLATTAGDEVMTFNNVVGTYSRGKFAFEVEIKGQDEKVEIKAEPERDSMDTLTATVTSTFEGKKYVRDTYDLVKAND